VHDADNMIIATKMFDDNSEYDDEKNENLDE